MDQPTAAAVLLASLVLLVQFLNFISVYSLHKSDFQVFITIVCALVIYCFLYFLSLTLSLVFT